MFVPQYLSHHQINQLLWDECIANAQNSMPYAYSWYLNTVAPDAWNALVLGDYVAVMPLPTRTKWSIVPYIYQPYWLQQLGIFSTFALSDNLINNFLKKIPVEFKLVDICLNEGNNFGIKQAATTICTRTNYILSLRKPYEALCTAYNQNTRRNLRKAQQSNLYVEFDLSASMLVQNYRQQVGNRQPMLKAEHYQQMETLIREAQKRQMAITIGIFDPNGRLHATAFFMKTHRRLINLLPASTPLGRQSGAMFLLLDTVIKQHAQTPLLFDCEGSMTPSVAQFYAGFGCKPTIYPNLLRNTLPKWVNWLYDKFK
jgi:hypothetical protein